MPDYAKMIVAAMNTHDAILINDLDVIPAKSVTTAQLWNAAHEFVKENANGVQFVPPDFRGLWENELGCDAVEFANQHGLLATSNERPGQ